MAALAAAPGARRSTRPAFADFLAAQDDLGHQVGAAVRPGGRRTADDGDQQGAQAGDAGRALATADPVWWRPWPARARRTTPRWRTTWPIADELDEPAGGAASGARVRRDGHGSAPESAPPMGWPVTWRRSSPRVGCADRKAPGGTRAGARLDMACSSLGWPAWRRATAPARLTGLRSLPLSGGQRGVPCRRRPTGALRAGPPGPDVGPRDRRCGFKLTGGSYAHYAIAEAVRRRPGVGLPGVDRVAGSWRRGWRGLAASWAVLAFASRAPGGAQWDWSALSESSSLSALRRAERPGDCWIVRRFTWVRLGRLGLAALAYGARCAHAEIWGVAAVGVVLVLAGATRTLEGAAAGQAGAWSATIRRNYGVARPGARGRRPRGRELVGRPGRQRLAPTWPTSKTSCYVRDFHVPRRCSAWFAADGMPERRRRRRGRWWPARRGWASLVVPDLALAPWRSLGRWFEHRPSRALRPLPPRPTPPTLVSAPFQARRSPSTTPTACSASTNRRAGGAGVPDGPGPRQGRSVVPWRGCSPWWWPWRRSASVATGCGASPSPCAAVGLLTMLGGVARRRPGGHPAHGGGARSSPPGACSSALARRRARPRGSGRRGLRRATSSPTRCSSRAGGRPRHARRRRAAARPSAVDAEDEAARRHAGARRDHHVLDVRPPG